MAVKFTPLLLTVIVTAGRHCIYGVVPRGAEATEASSMMDDSGDDGGRILRAVRISWQLISWGDLSCGDLTESDL